MKRAVHVSCVVAGAAVVAAALAGPLNPPAGPVTSTYKTLSEVEPRVAINAVNTPGDANSTFKISQPGSYYLTGNVTGSSGKAGIEVVASHVTIDLMGFELAGVTGSLSGVDLNNGGAGNILGVVVKNGSIRGWGDSGIRAENSARDRFEHLDISMNANYGIYVNSGTLIRACRLANNGLDGVLTSNNVDVFDCVSGVNGRNGFVVGTSSNIQNCEAGTNGQGGIMLTAGGVARDCVATGNGTIGIQGGEASVINDCRADRNQGAGIVVDVAGIVRGCTALLNGGNGIQAGANAVVESCSSLTNTGHGIVVTAGTVTGCTARDNTVDGIVVSSGSTVTNCSAAANDDDGIAAGSGCRIVGCTASGNGDDGIVVGSDCLVRGNNCDGNGVTTTTGAGIHVTPGTPPLLLVNDTRIEENNCTDSDFGIRVESSGHLVIRNSCSGNTTNFSVAAGCSLGTVLNVAGAAVTTTNSFANFEY